LTDLDFEFHLAVAIASANLVYPLIINSFKAVYTSLTGKFFRQYCNTPVVKAVHQFHVQIVDAIENRYADNAVYTMTQMLKHGESYLKGAIP
jgi:DNA-binding FadR family transcriptional regulator